MFYSQKKSDNAQGKVIQKHWHDMSYSRTRVLRTDGGPVKRPVAGLQESPVNGHKRSSDRSRSLDYRVKNGHETKRENTESNKQNSKGCNAMAASSSAGNKGTLTRGNIHRWRLRSRQYARKFCHGSKGLSKDAAIDTGEVECSANGHDGFTCLDASGQLIY